MAAVWRNHGVRSVPALFSLLHIDDVRRLADVLGSRSPTRILSLECSWKAFEGRTFASSDGNLFAQQLETKQKKLKKIATHSPSGDRPTDSTIHSVRVEAGIWQASIGANCRARSIQSSCWPQLSCDQLADDQHPRFTTTWHHHQHFISFWERLDVCANSPSTHASSGSSGRTWFAFKYTNMILFSVSLFVLATLHVAF